MTQRIMMAGLVSAGFQVMSLSNSTAVGLNSTTLLSSVLYVSVETNNARYRADGTDPEMTTGVLVVTGVVYRFEGIGGIANLKFQRSTGTSKVSLQAYKHIGDKAN